MTTSITKIASPIIHHTQRRNYRRNSLNAVIFFSSPLTTTKCRFTLPKFTLQTAAVSSSTSVIETTPESISAAEGEISSSYNILGCPICYSSLAWSGGSSLSIETLRGTTLQCNTCKKSYYGNESHFELTAASGSKDYAESMPFATEFFRTPIMSYLYERGWRQNFGLGGYPGPEKEVAEISRVLKPGGVFVATTTIGDGLFTLVPFRSTFREYFQQISGSRVFLSERELQDLCITCGLVDFRCTRNGLFVMISASKPS